MVFQFQKECRKNAEYLESSEKHGAKQNVRNPTPKKSWLT